MSRLSWYATRLRSMSAAEVAWRIANAWRSRLDVIRPNADVTTLLRRGHPGWATALADFRLATDRPIILDRARAMQIARDNPALVEQVIEAADRVRALRFDFFGYGPTQMPPPIDWNLDPLTGSRWPDLPSSRIDHRTADGDPKWIWELNRLQHLPWLAQAWLFTGDDDYAIAAFEQLDSWLDQNPPGRGIAWRGAFEAGIRAISVAVAVQGFRESNELTEDRYRAIVGMLSESARRCWKERSLYSSANNHLVGELVGAAVVAILFPELGGAPGWERDAVGALRVEADRQILPDGSGAEQAVGYQIFTAELILVVAALLARRDGAAPRELTSAIERSARYLAVLVGDDDPAPRYGDDDEGFALRLGPEPVRIVRDHLGIAGYGGTETIASHWLGGRRLGLHDSGSLLPPSSTYASDGGLVVLRAGRRRLTMDVGPLGYLSIAAHGHADALGLTLSVDGKDLIGDPGAASYYGHPEWRRVHRGTRTHATVCIDDQDQSVIAGPFMWTHHAKVHVRAVDLASGVIDAEHYGYRRLPGRPVHRRWLVADPDADTMVVVDLISGAERHHSVVSWPLHPTLDANVIETGFAVTCKGEPVLGITSAATASLEFHAVRGDSATDLGWWSDRLESRTPAWLLGASVTEDGPVAVLSVLSSRHTHAVAHARISLMNREIEASWTEDGQSRHLRIDPARDGSVIIVTRQ